MSSDYHPNGCLDVEEIIISSDPIAFEKFSTTFKPSSEYKSMFKKLNEDSKQEEKIDAIVLKCIKPELFMKFNPDYKKMKLQGRDFIYFELGKNKDKIGIYIS